MTHSPSGTEARWRTSSYSGAQSNCVEVALIDRLPAVRDSKWPAFAVLRFSGASWGELVNAHASAAKQ